MTEEVRNLRLSSVAQVIPGTSPSGRDINDRGDGLPFYQGAKEFGTRHPRPERFTTAPVKTARVGDILLSVRAPVGRVNIADHDCAIGRGVMAIRAKDPADGPYLAAFLQMMGEAWDAHATEGTMFANLSKVGLEQLSLRWPDSRHRIAEVLGVLDERIEALQRVERLVLDFGLASLDVALEAEGSRTMRVDEIATFENRKRIPLSQMERDQRPGPYPYYGATGIFGFVDDYLFDGFRVLVGEDGSVIQEDGTPVLQLAHGKYWVNNHAHVLVGNGVATEAIWFLLRNLSVGPAVTGAVQPKLSMGRLAALEVLVPSESSTFWATAKECIDQVLCRREELHSLTDARDFLLPRLVSGELRVSAAEELVADVI